MGYYTTFSMTVDKDGDKIEDWIASHPEDIFRDVFEYMDGGNWSSLESAKWYECDTDMAELSALFPDVLFAVTGIGEDTGDVWRTWYREGKILDKWIADIVIPEHPFSTTHLDD